jgi:hypothetical protein
VNETRSHPSTGSHARAAFIGLSALLVMGVVLGASLRPVEAVAATRESERAQTPARQFSATLAKAVRELVGGEHHKPALAGRGPVKVAEPLPAPAVPGTVCEGCQGSRHTVRVESLDLPPPAAAV